MTLTSNSSITPVKTAIAKVRALIIHPNQYERLLMEDIEDPMIDSGTTQHMTHDKKLLVDYMPMVKDVFVATLVKSLNCQPFGRVGQKGAHSNPTMPLDTFAHCG